MIPNDFSKILNRENTASVKYDLREKIFGKKDIIPLWVADMDFETPDFIIDRINQRLKHPVLGYTFRDEELNLAIADWQRRRHGWSIASEWISHCPGIVAGLNHAVQAFTNSGDRVMIQTPVYHPFFYAIKNNDRVIVENNLHNIDNCYSIDFDEFEDILRQGVKLFILCNPHNPVGRVWKTFELERIAELCLKHKVLIISDEIHADIVFSPHKHIPFASLSKEVSDNTITFGSASKTFNIAGLTTAFNIIPNSSLLELYNFQLEKNGTGLGNVLGYEATKAAYSFEGEVWLEQLLEYLWVNYVTVKEYITKYLPLIDLCPLEGTYLLWLDFSRYRLSIDELNRKLIHEAKIGLSSGEIFGKKGKGYQRMNIACSNTTINDVLKRLRKTFG